MRRAAPLALVLAVLAPATALAGPFDRDYSAYSLNIVPSGQFGTIPLPEGASTQAEMYDALTPLFDRVTDADVTKYFKSAKFGVGADGPGRKEALPRKDVTIVRDRYNVPHIRAKSYDAGIWAAGWVVAQDRGLLLAQARYNARVAGIDVPGIKALPLITSLRTFEPSAQTENVIARQTNVLKRSRKGRLVLRDIDTFVKGINAYLKKVKSTDKRWTRTDIYALNALKGQFLGQGGGDEARRTQFLSRLQTRLGAGPGLSVFNDLRQHDDPGQPTSIDGTFPYAPLTASRAGNTIIDPGSYKATPAATLPAATRGTPSQGLASNILMVSGKRSTTGRPVMVGGPQIGYFYPGLTLEMDMHAPGLVWRGVTSVPFPGYMLIGRGPDFANMLTSASADIVDQYAETLCDGSDTRYRYKGTCREMGVFNAGVLKGTGGSPDQTVSFRTTVHGPVTGYATVGGTRVAISSKRSSYGRDVLDQFFFRDLSTGAVRSPKTFFKAASQTPQTFNAFYMDHKNIAAYVTGRLPLRPADVDPGLLTNGDGNHEWTGLLPSRKHPQQANPKRGEIINWNNNVARGFGAADDEWMRNGATNRVDLLNRLMVPLEKAGGKHDRASLTAVMNAAATQDIRAVVTVPELFRLLDGSTPPSPRAKQMLDLLAAWTAAGSSRLDVDLDGKVDHAGAAILDGAWRRVADAFMAPVLGPDLDELATLVERHGFSQYTGWFQYFDKDIRTLLGDPVEAKFSSRYCGAGVKATCQADVWAALDAAGAEIAAAQGSEDPAAWRADAAKERIKFLPGILPTTIRWTNRPSGIQQVVSFKGHR